MTLTRGCGEPRGQLGARVCSIALRMAMARKRNFRGCRHGTGDRQHQRSRVAEVAVELDGPGAARQLRVQLIHLQVDVAELFLLVLHVVGELDVNDCQAGEAERANAEVGRAAAA